MALALRIVVRMICGVTLLEIRSWSRGSLSIIRMKSGNERFEGFFHLVDRKSTSRHACASSSDSANLFERNVSSLTNLQFT